MPVALLGAIGGVLINDHIPRYRLGLLTAEAVEENKSILKERDRRLCQEEAFKNRQLSLNLGDPLATAQIEDQSVKARAVIYQETDKKLDQAQKVSDRSISSAEFLCEQTVLSRALKAMNIEINATKGPK